MVRMRIYGPVAHMHKGERIYRKTRRVRVRSMHIREARSFIPFLRTKISRLRILWISMSCYSMENAVL